MSSTHVQFSRRRLIATVLALLLLAAGIYGLAHLGTFLAREDPLEQADAIFVFAGTFVERPLEAADLYRSGYAPKILVTRSMREKEAFAVARARGASLEDEFDVAQAVLQQLGVPAGAVMAPERLHDNTGQEAQTLREIAVREKWSRVIVVSSKYHLRRVSLACRRALAGTSVRIILKGTRYDPSVPDRWWQHRGDIRWMASEVPKLMLYSVGLG